MFSNTLTEDSFRGIRDPAADDRGLGFFDGVLGGQTVVLRVKMPQPMNDRGVEQGLRSLKTPLSSNCPGGTVPFAGPRIESFLKTPVGRGLNR